MTTPKVIKKPMPTHVDHTAQPFTGNLKVDATPLAAQLQDLPPRGMQGLRKALPGIDAVIAELSVAVPADGAAAGISPSVYASFVAHTTLIAQLQAVGTDAAKLAEVIKETIAIHVDAREQDLGQIVDAVKSTVKRKKSAGVGAPFAKTLSYRAQVADKAVATKKKKAAAKAAATTTSTPTTPVPAAGH